jgi:hypothetical protein
MRSEPTAYTARIVATGLATAAGAVLTSFIDSRGTLVGAVVVAMAVSAIGQAAREPLDRLERRIKRMGVARAILVISLVGFLAGTAAAGAHDIGGVGQLKARLARKLQPVASEEPVRAAPTEDAPADEDTKAADKPASKPASEPASKPASEPDKQRSAQPTPTSKSATEPPASEAAAHP